MPSPVSGNAQAQAATQLRIIDLDQVLDENISTSMNFAIDFASQTFRMTGLQFSSWLTENMEFDAINTAFDNTVFVVEFPSEPTPPEDVQDVIDFSLPILSNADAGNIGKIALTLLTNIDAVIPSGFHTTESSCVGAPTVTRGTVLVCAADTGETMQIYTDITNARSWVRVSFGGAFIPWLEIFSSDTRTSDEANTILDNADYGGIGKLTVPPQSVDYNTLERSGFYYMNAGQLNAPDPAGNYTLIVQGGYSGVTNQIAADLLGNTHTRSQLLGVWSAWQEIALTSKLPQAGVTASVPASGQLVVNFPVAFLVVPVVVATPDDEGNESSTMSFSIVAKSTTSFTIRNIYSNPRTFNWIATPPS